MWVGSTHTFGRVPYWPHVGHTATVVEHTDLGDGTSDVKWLCECKHSWRVAVGVDESEEAPEG